MTHLTWGELKELMKHIPDETEIEWIDITYPLDEEDVNIKFEKGKVTVSN